MSNELLQKSHPTATRIVPENTQHITVDKLKSMLPKNTNIAVTEEIVDLIHNMENDVGLPQEVLEEDLMSYTSLLHNMRGVGFKDLIKAVKFCNLKRLMGNKEAWSIVFPVKFNELVENNKQVDNFVSMYNKSKLVIAMDKEMLIPVHLMYAPYFHAAVKKQFELMQGKGALDKDGNEMTTTPMVQHLAAKELAVLTKQPEEQKLSIDINPGEAAISSMSMMGEHIAQLVAMQKSRLDAGEDIIDVQAIGLNFDELGISDE